MTLIPTVIEKTKAWERAYDIYSRLLEDRIIFVWEEVHSAMANTIIAQMLFLEKKDPDKDVIMYINTPWGEVNSGLAIYDTMQHIRADVQTICLGQAASMGAFLLSSGAKGKRMALPHSRIMIHQPLGGARGQATDIEIEAKEILRMKELLIKIMADNAGQDFEKVKADCERDHFLSAQESVDYGLIDKVVTQV